MFNIPEWILSGALLASPVLANSAQSVVDPIPLRTAQADSFNATQALLDANEALNRISTATGRFVQLDPSGHLAQGEFFISRPGRLRFEYDDPTPITLVSDGTTLAIVDRDLETVDRVPLVSTPLNLLLRKNADLAAHANILAIEKKGDFVSVRVSDKSEEAEGELELFFDQVSFDLKKWEVLDAFGQLTTVDLIDTTEGVSISPRQFRIDDPEDEDERRR